MTPDKEGDYPEARTVSDILQPLAKGAAEGVPFVGGVMAEMLALFWIPALERRQASWLRDLAEGFDRLSEDVADLSDRLSEERFLTLVVKAVRAATLTHEAEKRDALRAAVLNAALDLEPDEQIQLLFVSLVDQFTEAHIQLLKLLHDPGAARRARGVDTTLEDRAKMEHVITSTFASWPKELYQRLYADLSRSGLVEGGFGAILNERGTWIKKTTVFGGRFVAFITEPGSG